MLDSIPDDILLMIIDNLDYLDKCRLSHVNKHLSNIFDKYKNNISSETIIDITKNIKSYNNYHEQYTIDINKKLYLLCVFCVHKFPKIKMHFSNDDILLEEYYNNIYSYEHYYNFKPGNILHNVLTNCQNIKILNIVGYMLSLTNYNLSRLDKLKLSDCMLEDISMLGNINDLSFHNCNNITIFPKQFNCKYLSFSNCNFINNNNLININTYKLSLLSCNNITDLTKLNLSTIKYLIIKTYNNLIINKINCELEHFEIDDNNSYHINYLGDNIKKLSINCYNLLELPKIKYLEELIIYEDCKNININLDSFDYLKTLKIYHNKNICTLDNIKNISSLKLEGCYNLKNINSLINVKHMDVIDLSGCINIINISPLINIKTINELNLIGCKGIVDIEPLKDIISINVLLLNSCISINNFSYLSNIKMKKLYLSQCNIKNSDLKYFKNLEYLDISYIEYPLDITLLNNNNILEINSRN